MQLTGRKLSCPYCAALIEMLIDASAPDQQYIEECEVCCRPIVVTTRSSGLGDCEVLLQDENEALFQG